MASVFRVAAPDMPSLTEMRQLASQFGLPDDIYVEEPLTYYYSFGVTQTLTVSYDPDGTSIAYRALSDEADALPFEQALPIATTFLTERGLFDFPHRVIPGYGGEALFLRLVDGRPVTSPPELTVSVDTAGRVFALSYEPLPSFTLLGEYPLLSAQEAWQRVQAGTNGDFSSYNLYPIAPQAVEVPPDDSLPPWWGRTYWVGQQAKLWGYVTVFRPTEGDGPPRIRFGSAYPGEFWLEAPETELRAMATHREQIIRGWGMVTAISPLGGTLELAGWEIVPPAPEVVTLLGSIQRADDQTLLLSDTGQTLLLPDAPAELPDGYRVRVIGLALAIEPTDGPYPVFEWDAIERYGEGLTSAAPVESAIRQVVISEVELIYDYQSAAYTGTTDSDGLPLNVLLPAWRFSGTTNAGDTIEFIVPAVTDFL